MSKSLETIVKDDRWAVAEGMHNEKPLLIRFRNELQERPDVSAYPKLVKVVWSYSGGRTGLPDKSTDENMERFENHLVKAVEPVRIGVLVAVVTNDGTRKWVFYVSNVSAFGRALNDMPQEREPYPIQITAEDDPAWSFLYENIISGIK